MYTITVKLDRTRKEPLYRQLYQCLVEEIRAGNIAENERLPSKRSISEHLKISQSTVETAYEMLVAEGYVRAAARSGYYACRLETLIATKETPVTAIEPEPELPKYQYCFSTSGVDVSVFPYASWIKIAKEVMYQNQDLLQIGHPQGDLPLRQTLAGYLHELRGVRCSPEQIVVGAGVEYLMELIIQMLPNDCVFALEDPGYPKNLHLLRNAERKVIHIPLDENGMRVDMLKDSGADIAYITPSHQFPMGITMPAGRRTQLLNWASSQKGRYIIEDDYDSEFRFNGRPIPSLQGTDENGRVIYLGTFSRSIAPSIRIAYAVLPVSLLAVYRKRFWTYASTVPRFDQHTLQKFIADGHFFRHLNRVGNHYRQRKEFLLAELQRTFGSRIKIYGDKAGLHFLLQMKDHEEHDLVKRALQVGVRVYGLSEYTNHAPPLSGTVVLGYAGLQEPEIREALSLLKKAWIS